MSYTDPKYFYISAICKVSPAYPGTSFSCGKTTKYPFTIYNNNLFAFENIKTGIYEVSLPEDCQEAWAANLLMQMISLWYLAAL